LKLDYPEFKPVEVGKKRKAGERTPGTPFQRVDSSRELKKIKNDALLDNTYAAAFGEDGWGHRASEKLLQVRGKDFRHGKTKMKRGGYKGGAIQIGAVRSIKLTEDDY
jgi:hypothetical protein